MSLERLNTAVIAVRDEIDIPTYAKFAYLYMVLKYSVPEEKFEEQFTKVKNGMLRVFERLKNVRT
jgi:hypothetical protein